MTPSPIRSTKSAPTWPITDPRRARPALIPERTVAEMAYGGDRAHFLISHKSYRLIHGFGHGVWRSLVARFVRDEEAAGSNPVTPTISSP